MPQQAGQAGPCGSAATVLSLPRGLPACGVEDVQKLEPYAIYGLGKAMREISWISGDIQPIRIQLSLAAGETALRKLLSDGDPFPIHVSRGPAEALLNHLTEILDKHVRTVNEDGTKELRQLTQDDPPIPAFRWDWIRRQLASFEVVFFEEMREAATYYVPKKGIYITAALVDAADDTFPSDIVNILPDKARTEWCAAGRCLAFNLLSASGFHVARAVESTLEAYFQRFSAQPGKTRKTWGDYIDELEKIRQAGGSPAPAEKTLLELKQMKDDYRNPIMHPRVVLTEADSRVLFANGESLIILMAQELIGAAAGVQPTLLPVAVGSTP